MRLLQKTFCALVAASSVMAYADSSNVYLDQSQNILFDTFSPNAFSLQLLQVKNNFSEGSIIFGGSSEFDAQHWSGGKIEEVPAGHFYEEGNGFYFTEATLDVMNNVNDWLTVFGSVSDSVIGRSDPSANYVYTPNAFLLLGNLNKSPFYSTLGVSGIPFGVFSGSGPWDTPLNSLYFNPAQAPQVSVGYIKDAWNAVATAFVDQANYQQDYAYSLYYNKNWADKGYSLGVGYLTDLKTNATTNAQFREYGNSRLAATDISDFGSVVDLNAGFHYKQFSMAGEFDQGETDVNGNDGKPKAYSVIADYVKTIAGKETTFGVSHSETYHLKSVSSALPGNAGLSTALPGLKSAWAVNASRPIIKNVWLGLDVEKATSNPHVLTNSDANTYTTTLDLMAYF